MAFAIRTTWKNRNLPSGSQVPEDDGSYFDPDEAQNIINTIKHFTQRSSHENIMSAGDMREVLRTSSINPDTNPASKSDVEAMIRAKEENSAYRFPSNPTAQPITYGFSSGSTGKFHSGIHGERMNAELQKELDAVRARSRANRESKLGDIPEEDNEADGEVDASLPEDVASQIAKMRVSQRPAGEEPKELSQVRRALTMGFPARASMVRGFTYRQGSMVGGVKKTPYGIPDAF